LISCFACFRFGGSKEKEQYLSSALKIKRMVTKPVKRRTHGIIDYLFSGIQLVGPVLLRLNPKAVTTFRILGSGFLLLNALTNTPYGVKRLVSFKYHQRADSLFLAGLSLLPFLKFIGKNRLSLFFTVGFLGTAITHYMLTDYNAGSKK
jgi:hypothetical protein